MEGLLRIARALVASLVLASMIAPFARVNGCDMFVSTGESHHAAHQLTLDSPQHDTDCHDTAGCGMAAAGPISSEFAELATSPVDAITAPEFLSLELDRTQTTLPRPPKA
jgi:hypothetical protein